MCGFMVSTNGGNDSFIRRRGDLSFNHEENGYVFKHFLLPITGEKTTQPFVDDGIVCLYNGEIYNQPFKKSDGECLIPLYKKYGNSFPKYLDGEFAIALYDFKENKAIFSTDPFGTKPIWVNGMECASYESGVGGEKLPANTILVKSKKTFKMKVFDFDFENQIEETYDYWITAFEKAIKKRAKNGCFLGLSSGYDSGAIACEMAKQGIDFKAFMIQGVENESILEQRRKRLSNVEYLTRSERYEEEIEWVKTKIEPFTYKAGGKDIQTDSASWGLSKICRKAKSEGRNVYMSGQGADEIISDYSLYPNQSTFKGKFPDRLFVWDNFYEGCQYSYLGKEEYVAGSHAVETRYPFLDKDLVQEFLWLKPELKNKEYKAPIAEYLRREGYPFDEGKKIGFSIQI